MCINGIKERAVAFAALAHTKLLQVLTSAGNVVSDRHREATRLMLLGMAMQALGVESGRFAYGLPCGGGKTQGVAALILAAAEIEPELTFAVATSQVEALCQMKRQLITSGMSPNDIALWHSLKVDRGLAGSGTGFASEPATEADDVRPVLLLSHEKVRRLRDQMLQRSLIVWDESLISTQAQSLSVAHLNAANVTASTFAPNMTPHLAKVAVVIDREIAALQVDRGRQPKTLVDILTADEIESLLVANLAVNRRDPYGRALAQTVDSLITLLALPVSVVLNGNNFDGVIRYEISVDPALSNIAILDASHAIRLLTQADISIKHVKLPDYKRYARVTVRQIDMATGKHTMLRNEAASRPVARQVAKVIETLPSGERVLVFTFKDAKDQLRRNLAIEGVDTGRIEFATWGQETSRNEWIHCQHIIMAGVLRRNPLDLSASLLAQQRDMNRRNNAKALRDVTLSEMAHCILQGMNRGACRLASTDGEAHRMSLTILVSKAGDLRSILAECLPGVVWAVPEKPTGNPTKASLATTLIADYLVSHHSTCLPKSILKKEIPGLLLLNPRTVSEATMYALIECSRRGVNWEAKGRSLVRASF